MSHMLPLQAALTILRFQERFGPRVAGRHSIHVSGSLVHGCHFLYACLRERSRPGVYCGAAARATCTCQGRLASNTRMKRATSLVVISIPGSEFVGPPARIP